MSSDDSASQELDELLSQLRLVEDRLEAEAIKKQMQEKREKELRMIRKREAMEALLTKLTEGEQSPDEHMQEELNKMLSSMSENAYKTNLFRMLTRTIQSSGRQLSTKVNQFKIPDNPEARKELRSSVIAGRTVSGLLLLELTQIDPEGTGSYNSGLVTRMRDLKEKCEAQRAMCKEDMRMNIQLVEDRISFFIGVMTACEMKFSRIEMNRPQEQSVIQLTDVYTCMKMLKWYVENAHTLKKTVDLTTREDAFIRHAIDVNSYITSLQDDVQMSTRRLDPDQIHKQTYVSYDPMGEIEKVVIYRKMKRSLESMETLISSGVVDDIKTFTNARRKYDMGSIVTTLKNDAEHQISLLDN